jgi:hypothetical protein
MKATTLALISAPIGGRVRERTVLRVVSVSRCMKPSGSIDQGAVIRKGTTPARLASGFVQAVMQGRRWSAIRATMSEAVLRSHHQGRVSGQSRCRGEIVSRGGSFGRFVIGKADDRAAVGGQPLLAVAAGGGKGVGEHAESDVVVRRGPGPDLVLVQTEQVLALFVALLDPPTDSGDRDHVFHRIAVGAWARK